MRVISVFLAVGVLCMTSPALRAADADRDPRTLSASEVATFFPLVCKKHLLHPKDSNNCVGVLGMPDYTGGDATTLSLDAIAYGAFTKAGADQAYVTYTSDFEPHANNMGGGILFERRAGQWHLVRWFHAGQMDTCVALPPEIPQRMLCLSGYAGMGEVDSSVWVDRVPLDRQDKSASVAILKAQDDREANNGADGSDVYECTLRHNPNEAVLLSVDDLKRSTKPGIFAVSKITYVNARDATAACRAKHFEDAKETHDVVFYRLVQGKIVAQMPATFAHTDY